MDKSKLESLQICDSMTIKQAIHRLNETAKKILFTVDEAGRLKGTVADGDIRRGIIKGLGFDCRIEDVMYRDFVSLAVDMPDMTERAREIMLNSKIEQIPVLSKDGKIADVILWTDILGEEEQPKSKKLYQNQVVIMAGGKGTRLDPFTRILPKPLIPVGDKPVMELIMEKFYEHGFHRFFYTLNYKKEYLKFFLKENTFPYEIDWVEEEDFLGTAGSLLLLRDRIKETFFVANCDSLLDVNFEQVLTWHKEQNAAMTIVGCHNEIKIPFGILKLSNGSLNEISEKPTQDVIINTGVYVMEPRMISYIPDGRCMDMNTLIDLAAKKEKVTVYPIYGGWIDIGQMEEYKKCLAHFEVKNEP